MNEGDYTKQEIFDEDKIGFCWKKMPSRTFIATEEKSMPGIKASKDRLILLLGMNSVGDLKLKPVLIYYSENPRTLRIMSIPLCLCSLNETKKTGREDVFVSSFTENFKPLLRTTAQEKYSF